LHVGDVFGSLRGLCGKTKKKIPKAQKEKEKEIRDREWMKSRKGLMFARELTQ
jgi:hypothetical protein